MQNKLFWGQCKNMMNAKLGLDLTESVCKVSSNLYLPCPFVHSYSYQSNYVRFKTKHAMTIMSLLTSELAFANLYDHITYSLVQLDWLVAFSSSLPSKLHAASNLQSATLQNMQPYVAQLGWMKSGATHFLSGNGHGVCHTGEDSWFHKEALLSTTLASGLQLSSLFLPCLYQ